MNVAVATLPTRPVVSAAWLRHQELVARLTTNPALRNDPAFMAEHEKAERSWFYVFERWNGR